MEKLKRPKVTEGKTHRFDTGCGHLYVTVNKTNGRIFELFAHLGKAGGCPVSQLEALTRSITTGLRHNVPVEEYIKQLEKICCPSSAWDINSETGEGEQITSCADAIAKALKWQNDIRKEDKKDGNAGKPLQ